MNGNTTSTIKTNTGPNDNESFVQELANPASADPGRPQEVERELSKSGNGGDISSRPNDHADLLNQTDVALVRVLEDLIDALITRGVIQFTDLPQAAQAKLLERRQSRASLAHRLDLMPFGDDDGLV